MGNCENCSKKTQIGLRQIRNEFTENIKIKEEED